MRQQIGPKTNSTEEEEEYLHVICATGSHNPI